MSGCSGDFLMSARGKSLHDCHIPCVVHSQEGHSIHHTFPDKVHSAYSQYVCNVELQKLLMLTRVIPAPRTMHDNAIDIYDWNTSHVCQYCCCGPELVPHIHDIIFYLHGGVVLGHLPCSIRRDS